MLHFYHHPMSAYSQKVFFLLEEAKLTYDLRTISLERREQREEKYLSLNPAGRVPTVVDGDLRLSESNAIMRYLTRKYQLHHLYPISLREQAEIDCWWEFCSHHINRPLMDLAWNRLLAHKMGFKPDQEVISKAEAHLRRDLPVLDRHLMDRHYLVGPSITLADINATPFVVYLEQLYPGESYPYIRRWIRLIQECQSWRNVVAFG